MPDADILDSHDWARCRSEWSLADGVTYLNHGSFGPSPTSVQRVKQQWSETIEREPMDFFVRQLEGCLDETSARLGKFVGASGEDLIFVDNATAGMNLAALNTPLKAGDEVLFTDHEYGAVERIWRSACQRAGAELVFRALPLPLTSADEAVARLFEGVTPKTKILVVSHVTSPTSVVFPVEKICRQARERGVQVCVDGPHALVMTPVNLKKIDCDYYTASCHKWLSAPFGTGFLYVAKRRQQAMKPQVTSWGRSLSGRPYHWKDEFNWVGTRDLSGTLAIPAAIEFFESFGLDAFRQYTHELARYAHRKISELTGLEPFYSDSSEWYGSMLTLPLPPIDGPPPKLGEWDKLQEALWRDYHIEAIVNRWKGGRNLRVSCQIYNHRGEIDLLVEALQKLVPELRG